MNSEDRDTREILMMIGKTTMFMDPFMRIMGVGTIKLITQFARMVKENKLSKRQFKDFQEFAKITEGKYSIINVPTDTESGFRFLGQDSFHTELKQLDQLGIRYSLLPDLNTDDQYVQLAIMDEDKDKFNAWYDQYLAKKMSGGEHNLQSLKNLTSGGMSLISVPLEGKEEILKKDFQTLGINYSILPDLRVGDGQIQIAVADIDMQKVEHWYKLYQEDMLKEGVQLADFNKIDMGTYKHTGEMTEDDYMNTADEEIQNINKKYEKEAGALERSMKIPLESDESVSYEAFENDLLYQKFTINDETMVNPYAGTQQSESMAEKGFFMSCVPYSRRSQFLLVPRDQVFISKDGKTYTAFLKKSEQPVVLDRNFNIVSISNRLNAKDLFHQHYDLSNREQNITQNLRNMASKQAINKVKQPSIPKKSNRR